jgi:pseudaminic acid synthase
MNLKFGIPHQRLSRFAQIHALFPTTIRVVKIPTPLAIAEREIGVEASPFFIAEISANHGGELSSALELVDIAAKAGASAIKIQHYTPETITTRSTLPEFQIGGGTLWDGRQLFDLYAEAMTPWEWTKEIFLRASENGLICFSSPFDTTAVDFLEEHNVVAYKVASFELVDIPLIEYIARTGKPMIMSTGMATIEEIDNAVNAARGAGNSQLALLRCNSGYPANPHEMDLRAIPFMRDRWDCEIGLSDHTLDSTSSIAAIALGATIIEKHIIADRSAGGPDAAFSCEPLELSNLIQQVNDAHSAIGSVRFGPSDREKASIAYRRSLRVSSPIRAGDIISVSNVRSMRPAGGLLPIFIKDLVGKRVSQDLVVGAAITWDVVE